jgi:prepilin-type processing-associated H-X9-DG protein
LLPFIEQEKAYTRLRFDQSPGNALNKRVRETRISTFRCPSDWNRLNYNASGNHYGWGKNNYKANAGSDSGRMVDQRENNNGIFVTNKAIRDKDVKDGLTNTAFFSEGIIGDGDVNANEIPGDWFRISEDAEDAEEVYQACLNVVPKAGPVEQIAKQGRNWVWGNYIPTRYNHIMPPNMQSCARKSSTSNNLDATVNDKGGATTASSRHSGGVNLSLGDGSTRFIIDAIDVNVWWALGSRDGKEVIPADY